MTASVGQTGAERFADDLKEGELRYVDASGQAATLYSPYSKQEQFHNSPTKHRLLGGAAGPGKTLALIMDHMMGVYEFTDPDEARQVHTLLLRRTNPKLESTLITRFREKIPKELYSDYNETKKIVTWLNGATTRFGSMQYEHDVYGWQGQWYKIGYDELAEFTFKQWSAISAWNRCPVSPYATKEGASNPIGPGAGWVKSLFIDHVPYEEMDDSQRSTYLKGVHEEGGRRWHDDYQYFPCTYLDNPVYANDPNFLQGLEQYPAAERDALKYAIWGVAGGYFSGAWDPAENVYDDESFVIQPWHKRWIGGDWGHEHWAANYWLTLDDFGVIRIYKEGVTNHLSPSELGEYVAKHSYDDNGKMPKFERFMYSHDAFHQKYDANTVAVRMGDVLRTYNLPTPTNAGTDKIGREQLFYQLLKSRITIGEGFDAEKGASYPIKVAGLQIARSCRRLIQNVPLAPREEGTELGKEKIAQFPGLDMIDGAGHGLYGMARNPAEKPFQVKLAEAVQPLPVEGTARFIKHLSLNKEEKQKNGGVFYLGRKPRRK